MNRFLRQLLFASALLGLFLAASALALRWMRERSDDARRATLVAKQAQLEAAIALLPAGGEWNPTRAEQLGRALGAEVRLWPTPAGDPDPTPDARRWSFTYRVADAAGDTVALLRVAIAVPATVRLTIDALRVAMLSTVVALALLGLAALLALFSRRGMATAAPETDGAAAAGWQEVPGIAELAKVSARQGVELAEERTARQLLAGDLALKQELVERAFADRVQMGRDLHDGIVQSLYATGLTLQTVRRLIATKPDQAALQLESALRTLNATIGEIRRVIGGMTESGLRQAGFRDCVNEMLATLAAGREVAADVRIDDDAAAALGDAQFSECLQVVREAVSNALRHGAARHLTVRFHRNENALCLLVQDDGRGFAPETTRERGHGLANMEARAKRLGGSLRFQSAPGEGTRIVLTFAAPAATDTPPSASA